MHPEHRNWLTSDEHGDVQRELVLIFPLPMRRSLRTASNRNSSILVPSEQMPEEINNYDSGDDDVFTVNMLADKCGIN